jgi:hypothetical protein
MGMNTTAARQESGIKIMPKQENLAANMAAHAGARMAAMSQNLNVGDIHHNVVSLPVAQRESNEISSSITGVRINVTPPPVIRIPTPTVAPSTPQQITTPTVAPIATPTITTISMPSITNSIQAKTRAPSSTSTHTHTPTITVKAPTYTAPSTSSGSGISSGMYTVSKAPSAAQQTAQRQAMTGAYTAPKVSSPIISGGAQLRRPGVL